jgi:hypothetical protein
MTVDFEFWKRTANAGITLSLLPETALAAVAEVERLRALLDRAWDRLPEGHTVLRGQILTALGQPGCTDCGYDCTETPCTAKRDDLRAPSHAKEDAQ